MNSRPINNPGRWRPNLSGIDRPTRQWVEPTPSSGDALRCAPSDQKPSDDARFPWRVEPVDHEGCTGNAGPVRLMRTRRRIGRAPCPASTDGLGPLRTSTPPQTRARRFCVSAPGATSSPITRLIRTATFPATLAGRVRRPHPARARSASRGSTRPCSRELPGASPACSRPNRCSAASARPSTIFTHPRREQDCPSRHTQRPRPRRVRMLSGAPC